MIAYQLSFERHPQYIHATVTGTNSRDAVQRYLEDVRRECVRQDCYRVLVEERLEGPRLPTMDVFAIASEGSMKALGIFHAIAYVDQRMGDMAEFAEMVAVNRGMPVRAFSSVEKAENWLCAQQEGVREQDIFQHRDG
ncbi:MAG: hypothetical protein WD795_06200 [Woeseia sp.]